jgi:preprotein translocase subunit YajC
MSTFIKAILGFYGLVFIVFIALIVFLIIKRQKSKETETFEKRDN